MDYISMKIKVKDGELEKIFDDLEKAKEIINDCYYKLRDFGVLVVEKNEPTSGN